MSATKCVSLILSGSKENVKQKCNISYIETIFGGNSLVLLYIGATMLSMLLTCVWFVNSYHMYFYDDISIEYRFQ